ncbi:MAG: MCE family protein [Deltaproteobacteria bacterium]|nr:MCE family protein [Candidatus Anaeroferrophillus wilburensis]MBN2889700.1 MCE family protein [Deltaproteobacteria bacterium]
METKANYFLVGSMVVILSIIMVIAMLWFAEKSGQQDSKKFTIYFEQYSLAGLQVDSAVTMKGIRVGSVDQLNISSDNIEQVKVVIKLNASAPVKTDTEAVVKRNLLTGLANIDLINSHQESPLLQEIPKDEKFPVIPEGQTELTAMITDALPTLLANVDRMISNANTLLSPENQQLFHSLLQDLAGASKQLADGQARLTALIDEATRLAGTSRTMVAHLDQRTARMEESITATIGMAQETITAAGPVLTQFHQLAASLENNSRQLNDMVSGSATTIALEMEYLTGELVKTAQQITDTLEQYKQPREIIWGPDRSSLGPGEGGRK